MPELSEVDTCDERRYPVLWIQRGLWNTDNVSESLTDFYASVGATVKNKGCVVKRAKLLNGAKIERTELVSLVLPALFKSAELNNDIGLSVIVAHVASIIKSKESDDIVYGGNTHAFTISASDEFYEKMCTVKLFKVATKYLKTKLELQIVAVALDRY